MEASTALAAKKVVGDPFDEKTEQGPQVDSDQMHSILDYIRQGKEAGAQLHTGAHPPALACAHQAAPCDLLSCPDAAPFCMTTTQLLDADLDVEPAAAMN